MPLFQNKGYGPATTLTNSNNKLIKMIFSMVTSMYLNY